MLLKKVRIIYVQLCDKIGRQMRKFTLGPLERKRLKKKKFTIISQNCTGSIWYHDLDIPFYSPTIKMRFEGNDYIKFLKNLRHYLYSDFEFWRNDQGQLKGILGNDIHMSFIHWKSSEEVVSKWAKRRQRILEPIIVLAFAEDMSDETIHEFLELNEYPNRLLFIDKGRAYNIGLSQTDIVRFIPGNRDNAKALNFCSILGHRFYQCSVDYVDYINNAISNG